MAESYIDPKWYHKRVPRRPVSPRPAPNSQRETRNCEIAFQRRLETSPSLCFQSLRPISNRHLLSIRTAQKSKSALSATSAGTLFLAKPSSNCTTRLLQLTVKRERKILAGAGEGFWVVSGARDKSPFGCRIIRCAELGGRSLRQVDHGVRFASWKCRGQHITIEDDRKCNRLSD
jgi:hypothetical protein